MAGPASDSLFVASTGLRYLARNWKFESISLQPSSGESVANSKRHVIWPIPDKGLKNRIHSPTPVRRRALCTSQAVVGGTLRLLPADLCPRVSERTARESCRPSCAP